MIGTSQRGESMRVPWRVSIVAWMSLGRPGDGSRSEEGEVRSEEVGRFVVGGERAGAPRWLGVFSNNCSSGMQKTRTR